MKRSVFFSLIILTLLLPLPVWAHPIDEIDGAKVYDQKQTITVGSPTQLTIDLDIYAIEKIRIWESIDRNRDRSINQEEKNRWIRLGASASYITDSTGKRFVFTPAQLDFPEYYDFFDRPPGRISIRFDFDGSLTTGNTYTYHYIGKDKTLSEIKTRITGSNGFGVTAVTKKNPSAITFTVTGDSRDAGSVLGITTGTRLNEFLSTYVKPDTIPTYLLFGALGAAFFIGALHAMTPGHGKAIVAGYLVGSRGTAWHAVNLALIITVTHTASVFLLGLSALFLTQYFVPTQVIQTLNYVSGILVVGFGLTLLMQRIKMRKINPHPHAHMHSHDPGGVHNHTHIQDMPLTWKNLLPLGISGGIVPCVDALAILVVAATLGKLAFGIWILLAFSVGLAAALTAAGMVAVIAKDRVLKRWSGLENSQSTLGIISAGFVTLLGFAILAGVYI